MVSLSEEESSYVPVKKRITMVKGTCQGGNHVIGDSWIVERVTPEGMCIHTWDSLSSYLLHLDMNGKFWGDEPYKYRVHCPDLENGIVFEVERIFEE